MVKKQVKKTTRQPSSEQTQMKEMLAQLQKSNQALLTQNQLLQEQLQQKKSVDEERQLESEAEQVKKQQAQLAEDANLRSILAQATRPDSLGDRDIDELSQKDMIDIVANSVGKALDAQSKLMEQKLSEMLKPTNERLNGTQKALIEMMAANSVKKARDQYQDFDEYREDVGRILQENPMLSPERAYVLAKAEKSLTTPAQREVASERPNNATPYLQPHQDENAESYEDEEPTEEPSGISTRRDFRDQVSKAIDKVLAGRQK